MLGPYRLDVRDRGDQLSRRKSQLSAPQGAIGADLQDDSPFALRQRCGPRRLRERHFHPFFDETYVTTMNTIRSKRHTSARGVTFMSGDGVSTTMVSR